MQNRKLKVLALLFVAVVSLAGCEPDFDWDEKSLEKKFSSSSLTLSATYSDSTLTVSWTANDGTISSDSSATVYVYLDGSSIGSARVSKGTWSRTIDLSGKHSVFLKVYDSLYYNYNYAYVTASNTVSFTVVSGSSLWLTLSATYSDSTLTLNWTANDGTISSNSSATVYVYLDGSEIGSARISDGTCSIEELYTGTHSVVLKVKYYTYYAYIVN